MPKQPLQNRDQEALVRLGANVRRERMRQGLTQEALAELVDVHPSMVKKIEAGRTNTLTTTTIRIQGALGCSWDALLLGANAVATSDATQIGRRLARVAAKSSELREILGVAHDSLSKLPKKARG